MIMKQKVLALSIAAALAGVAGTASAALQIREAGVGHALITPYFTAQNGNVTLLSIVNTDTVNAKAVKVRFRSAVDSDDIFDFQVFLSPTDVWTAQVSPVDATTTSVAKLIVGTNGSALDTSCSIPSTLNIDGGNSFVTSRLVAYTDPDSSAVIPVNQQTREGYVEIFNMADIPPTLASGVGTALNATVNPLFTAIKHVSNVPPCRTSSVSQALLENIEVNNSNAVITVPQRSDGSGTVGAANYTAGQQLVMPTTGLMGNWVILNLGSGLSFSGDMAAIQADTANGDQTMVVYSGQTADARTATAVSANSVGVAAVVNTFPNLSLTADRVLQLGSTVGVAAAKYDFPDMSTPYLAAVNGTTPVGSLTPNFQANNLSFSIMRRSIINEFSTTSAFGGGTDWVASMPTRRYHVAGRGTVYAHQATGANVAVNGGVSAVTFPFAGSVGVNNCVGTTPTAIVTFAANGRSSRVTTQAAPQVWNREETTSNCVATGPVFSPASPTSGSVYQLNGEVNVLSWNGASGATTSSVLGASVVTKNVTASISSGTTELGWSRISLTDGTLNAPGLPMLGTAFSKAQAPRSAPNANIINTFGYSSAHRFQ